MSDIEAINSRVVTGKEDLPPGIQVATFNNADRDAINTAVFEEYCHCREKDREGEGGANCFDKSCQDKPLEDVLVVLMDNLKIRRSRMAAVPVKSARLKKSIWTKCGESDLWREHGRRDPALKLYCGCPVMLTENEDVARGLANGTKALVKEVKLKEGEQLSYARLANGTLVRAVFASQVDAISLVHCNPNIRPPVFETKAKQVSFEAMVPMPRGLALPGEKERIPMSGNQFAFVSNAATTGHKLQGSTLDSLFVHTWRYAGNWVYVVLSRVKSLDGLYMRVPLTRDLSRYKGQPELEEALRRLRERCPLVELDREFYDAILRERAEGHVEEGNVLENLANIREHLDRNGIV